MCSNKTVNYYTVKILDGKENVFKVEKIKVIAENEFWIILDTQHFEQICKTKTFEFCHNRIDKHKIKHTTNETYFDNGIFYTLVTSKTKKTASIKKEIKKYINEKFGFLDSIDLSFIK